MRVLLVASSSFGATCQKPPPVRCAEFDEAQTFFEELTTTVLDTTFQDPRFIPAAERFEAVPAHCERYDRAVAFARSIRDAQKERKVEAQAAPDVASVRPKRTVGRARGPKRGAPAILQCDEFVAEVRRDCPAGCRELSPNAPKGACIDRCEEGLVEWLAEAGCPAVKRLPRAYVAPEAPSKPGATSEPEASPPPPPPPPPTSWTYCSYFLGAGSLTRSLCFRGSRSDAQKHCDGLLAKRGVDGTCDCTEDETFIGEHCKKRAAR